MVKDILDGNQASNRLVRRLWTASEAEQGSASDCTPSQSKGAQDDASKFGDEIFVRAIDLLYNI